MLRRLLTVGPRMLLQAACVPPRREASPASDHLLLNLVWILYSRVRVGTGYKSTDLNLSRYFLGKRSAVVWHRSNWYSGSRRIMYMWQLGNAELGWGGAVSAGVDARGRRSSHGVGLGDGWTGCAGFELARCHWRFSPPPLSKFSCLILCAGGGGSRAAAA